jgi:hypothetical protein
MIGERLEEALLLLSGTRAVQGGAAQPRPRQRQRDAPIPVRGLFHHQHDAQRLPHERVGIVILALADHQPDEPALASADPVEGMVDGRGHPAPVALEAHRSHELPSELAHLLQHLAASSVDADHECSYQTKIDSGTSST